MKRNSLLFSALLAGVSLGGGLSAESLDLMTRDVQISFNAEKGKKLMRTYFGSRLKAPGDARFASRTASPALPVLADSTARWENATGELAAAVTQADGHKSLELVYDSHEVLRPEPGRELVVFHLKDTRYPVKFRLYVQADEESNVFEQWVEILNEGTGAVTVDLAESGHLLVKADRYFVTTFRGTWGGESLMNEEEVRRGNTLSVGSDTGTRTAQEGTPGFVLSLGGPAREDEGAVYMGALAWSGNYKLNFKHSPYGNLFASFGVDMSFAPYRLEGGKSLTLPRCILTFSDRGKGEASRQMHRWARRGGVRGGDRERMTLLNSWEGAYFKFDEPLLHGMMERASGMGVELFVLDDGWFANKYPRNADNAGLGDWTVNEKKLPNGLSGLVKAAEERKIKFGLWVEPEMVNPKSELYEKHPDWVIGLPGREPRLERSQLVLDLTNPAVCEYLLESMDRILTENPGICYVKWDCNRKISDPGSPFLPATARNNLFVDYVNGYYGILEALTKKHPGVVFQACASGGGRADYGAMKYHHEFWVSDNTDPYERVYMQWGIGHLFPALSMASHVTASPNHQTGRETPLKFRFDVAMSARLGFELNPQNMSQKDVDFSQKALAEYKRIRPVVQMGDLYRLKSPYENRDASLMYVLNRDGKRRAVVFAYLMDKRLADVPAPIRLKGLDASRRYKVTELNRDDSGNRTSLDGQIVGGDSLMKNGIEVSWRKAPQSLVLELEEQP